MATSRGQAAAHGHSGGSFGHGGTHAVNNGYGTVNGGDHFLLNSNMMTEVESTAGSV